MVKIVLERSSYNFMLTLLICVAVLFCIVKLDRPVQRYWPTLKGVDKIGKHKLVGLIAALELKL